jgi:iron complex transport system permease protein
VSGFVSGAASRLTARRLVVSVAACLAVTAAIVAIAPLVGVTVGRSGAHFELLGTGALDPGSPDHQILWFRITRALACALTGAALAGAGCALQAILRNPLAEPFTLGISSGSSLAAVLAIRLGAEAAFGRGGVAIAALLGAAVTLAIVWQLGRIGRQLPPATLILAGVTISMLCAAASVLVQYTSDFQDVSHMLTWMVGGLESVQLSWVQYATPPILLGLVVLVAYARELNALAAGPEAAASVGVAVGRTQNVVFAVASLLVGTAISLVGPIGFIGLIIPHALRAVLGPDHRVLLPTSMLGGAAVLTICDTLARTVAPMNHLPTGALTAVLGAGFFLVILLGHKRKASLWGRA